MGRNGFFIFVLMALLIVVVYYVGAATDFSALAKGSQTLIYALTGRNASGQFASYPTGASLPGGVAG